MQLRLPTISTSNAIIAGALKLAFSIWVLLAVAALFVMSLGTDEAWVLNGLRSVLHPQVQNLSTELIVTSGGVFALLNLAVEWAFGSQLWLHRSLSLLGLSGVVALVLHHLRVTRPPLAVQLLAITPLLAVPGTIEVGTAALGTLIGLFLMVASMFVWTAPAISLAKRIIFGGLLFGLAAASRFDLVLFGFAVLLSSCVSFETDSRLKLRISLPAIAFLGIGMSVFFLNQWIMSQPANGIVTADIGAATGLGGRKFDYPKLLNNWLTLSTFFPVSLVALSLLSAFWLSPEVRKSTQSGVPRLGTLLAVTGLVLLVAWLFRAPIAHLRYVFPALFCFAFLGAIGLQRIAAQALSDGQHRHWLFCQCLGLTLMLGSIGNTTRSLVMSDSDYASWEWTHEMPYDYFRRFEAQHHQREVAAFLQAELPKDARVYSYVPYALRYLTERPVVAIDLLQKADPIIQYKNRYLVLTPAIGTYFYLNSAASNWILENAKLTKQIGRFSIYQLKDGNDADLEALQLRRTNYDKHPNSALWFGR